MQVDSITQFGLSVTGDTVWTYSKGNVLRFWNVDDGKLIFEKSFPHYVHISRDLKTYTKITYTNIYNDYVQFTISGLFDDILISDIKPIHHTLLGFSMGGFKPDFNHSRNLLAVGFNKSQGYLNTTTQGGEFQLYNIEKDTFQLILSRGGSNDYVFAPDRNIAIGSSNQYYSYKSLSYSYNYNSGLFYYDIQNKVNTNIVGYTNKDNNPSFSLYSYYSRLGNMKDYAGIYIGDKHLYVYDLSNNYLVQKYNFSNYGLTEYCFAQDDEYIAFSNVYNKYDNGKFFPSYKIFIYDLQSRTVVDSVSPLLIRERVQLKYSNDKNVLAFAYGGNFGLYRSKYFGGNDSVLFTVSTNHVYPGEYLLLFNRSSIQYDTIEWILSDGQTSNEEDPVFKFDKNQLIDVTLKFIKDGKEYSLTKKEFITVLPTLSADFDANIYQGSVPLVVNFKDLSSGDLVRWEWDYGDKYEKYHPSWYLGPNPSYKFLHPGRYNITLTVYDNYTSSTITKDCFIQVDCKIVEVPDLINRVELFVGQLNFSDGQSHKIYDYIPKGIGTHVGNDTIYAHFNGVLDIPYKKEILYHAKLTKDLQLINDIYTPKHYFNTSSPPFSKNSHFYYAFLNRAEAPQQDGYRVVGYDIDELVGETTKTIYNYWAFNLNLNWNNKAFNDEFFLFSGNDNLNSMILKIDYDFNVINTLQIPHPIIDFDKHLDKEIYILVKDSVSKSYKFLIFDIELDQKNLIDINIQSDISIKALLGLPNATFAFCGENTTDSIGVIGAISNQGEILWMKTVTDWLSFDKLYGNRNNFFATGMNIDSLAGFVESDAKGENIRDNRLGIAFTTQTCDIDIIDDETLIVSAAAKKYVISKVRYKPLEQSKGEIDTSGQGGGPKHSILAAPNPAENTVSLRFADEQNVRKVRVYDYSGIEIMQFDYSSAPLNEVLLPLHALSIGMYHVTVTTDSGILRTKFIKY
jgi:PKD repeat protein